MHILIIASWYKSANNPTAGSFIEEQARMLQEYGHRVTVFHPFIAGTFIHTLKGAKSATHHFNDQGIETYSIQSNVIIPKFRQLSYKRLFKNTLITYNQYIKQWGKPDIIHSHALFMGGIIGHYLSKKFCIPHFHTEHTSGLIFNPKQYTKADKKLLKTVYSACKSVYFVSSFAKSEVIKFHNLKNYTNLSVLPNIVKESFFILAPLPNDATFKFLSIGSLIPIKNFDFLLKSWSIFTKNNPNSKLTIAGSGYEETNLKKLIEKLNLSNSLEMLPTLNRDEVKTQIDNHHVIISTSKLETFGLTIAEANASGRPAVVSNSGGVEDIILPEIGIVVNHFDEAQFAEALVEIKRNYFAYKPELISQLTLQRFGKSTIYNILINDFKNTLKQI